MTTIAIDLGTAACKAAYWRRDGIPGLVPDIHSSQDHQTPSVVCVQGGEYLVGVEAENAIADDLAMAPIPSLKQCLATARYERAELDSAIHDSRTATQVLLQKILRDAEVVLRERPVSACLTVPGSFTQAERQQLAEAARSAGLQSLAFIDSQAAVAQGYGLGQGSSTENVLVHDFGAGMFEAGVVLSSRGELCVRGAQGLRGVGGLAVDEAIADWMWGSFAGPAAGDWREDAGARRELRSAAEAAKVKLGSGDSRVFDQQILWRGRICDLLLTRSDLEGIARPFILRTLNACRQALELAEMNAKAIDRILLAGGSSLLPGVQALLGEELGVPIAAVDQRQVLDAAVFGAAMTGLGRGSARPWEWPLDGS